MKNPKVWLLIGLLYILSSIPDNYLGFGGDGVVMICAVYSAVIYYNVCQL